MALAITIASNKLEIEDTAKETLSTISLDHVSKVAINGTKGIKPMGRNVKVGSVQYDRWSIVIKEANGETTVIHLGNESGENNVTNQATWANTYAGAVIAHDAIVAAMP